MSDLSASSAAATAPAFAGASQTAGDQKTALLGALAQAGTAGAQQYAAQQQQNQAQKQAALQAATQREAVVQNMPPALAAQLGVVNSGIISPTYDAASQNMAVGQQQEQQNLAQISQAGNTYGTEVQQAIPIVQADTQGKVAALQAAAQAKAAADAQALALGNLQLQKGQVDLQTAQANAGATTGLSSITGLPKSATALDVQTLGTQIQDAQNTYVQQQLATQNSGSGPSGQGQGGGATADQLAQDFLTQHAKDYGMTPAQAQALLEIGGTKTTQQQQTLSNSQLTNQLNSLKLPTAQTTNTTGANDARSSLALTTAQQALSSNAFASGNLNQSNLVQAVTDQINSSSPPGSPPISPATVLWALNQSINQAKGLTTLGGS